MSAAATPRPTDGQPLLAVEGLGKTFPGQVALADVSLGLHAGEVCALVGQNGSGKSTLIKLLAGFHEADPGGTVTYKGHTASIHERHGAGAAWRERVRFIHQELGLVETLGTLDNLALGRGFATGRLGRILWRREAARARELFADFGMDFDLGAPVATLSGAERTMIAVARALLDFDDAGGVLILDEPTASLSGAEAERLYAAVRRTAARGAAVVFVSHRLEEVLDLCQRVVVLREGRLVADRPVAGLDHDGLIELIVGRPLEAVFPGEHAQAHEVLLEVEGLSGRSLREASFTVRAGEVLGVAGVNGSGRDELAGLLFGSAPASGGEVRVAGEAVPATPRAAMRRGIALVPADRPRCGVIGRQSIRENVTLPALKPLRRLGAIDRGRERAEALSWCRRVELAPLEIERPVVQLSGGNQQKAVLAKWLRRGPRVLVLDEPTQGVDVGAKAAIYRLIHEAAQDGAAVVVCSSDVEELAELVDRAIVLTGGRVSAELTAAQVTAPSLTEATLRRAAA